MAEISDTERDAAHTTRRTARTTVRVLALVAVLCALALVSIVHLQRNATASSRSQLTLQRVSIELQTLLDLPFRARPQNGGTPALARTLLRRGEARSTAAISALQKDSPPPQLGRVRQLDRAYFETLHRIYLVGISPGGYGPKADRLGAIASAQLGRINTEIAAADRAYAARALTAQNEVLAGSGAAVTLLFLAFAAFYRRSASAHLASVRLAEENGRLLETSRTEARTDPLTGLPNRRALMAALDAEFEADAPAPAILVLYDLDGFKRYNDTFGHPAGDALLVRLGARLQAGLEPIGATAYRMGGDEFSVLAPADCAERAVWAALTALSEHGEGFQVTSAYGIAEIPTEAGSVAEALHVADLRMYADKSSGRPPAIDQSTDVLLALIDERGADLRDHVENVALLAELTAERMGLPVADIRQVVLAARLHDIGMAAIPDAIVTKPDDLDLDEWEFMRRDTLIGERIIRAAPALAGIARIVRQSHERFDGTGYPDGVAGDEIPIGARIINVCDAYDTMVSGRVYREPVAPAAALAELRRCAGTHFDSRVVEAFCAVQAQLPPRESAQAA